MEFEAFEWPRPCSFFSSIANPGTVFMKLYLLLAALIAIPAEADEIEDILGSGQALEVTGAELNEIFKGVQNDGFEIDRHVFMDVAGVYSDRKLTLSSAQLTCAVNQLQALKKVDWKKYTPGKVKIGLNTKRHMVGNSLKPIFRHDALTQNPETVAVEYLHLLHVYLPEHEKCDVWEKARIEAQLDAEFSREKELIAKAKIEREEAQKLAQDSKEKKQRLIDLLQKTSLNGRAPAVAARPGECDPGQTICAQQSATKYEGEEPSGRVPAFLGTVKAVD